MTFREFKLPNFRCRVTDQDDDDPKPKWILIFAEDKEAARKFLADNYLEVENDRIESYDFDEEWSKKTKDKIEAAKAAIAAGQKYEFPAEWGDLKYHLQSLFHFKCAYCEADFTHVGYGDVEHFRPKGKVTGAPAHPGYYWLAYDPKNYLPSCQLCNQKGKKNKFPIEGLRAMNEEDPLENERPLLVNPWLESLADHVTFNPSDHELQPAKAVYVDEKGKESIEVYGLNRPRLLKVRRESQALARQEYKQAWVTFISNGRVDMDKIEEDCKEGRRQFFTAIMAELNAFAESKDGIQKPFDIAGVSLNVPGNENNGHP